MRQIVAIVIIGLLCATGALALRVRQLQIQYNEQSVLLDEVLAQVEELHAQSVRAAAVQASLEQLQAELVYLKGNHAQPEPESVPPHPPENLPPDRETQSIAPKDNQGLTSGNPGEVVHKP